MTNSIAVSTIAKQAFRIMKLAPISSFADDSEQAAAAGEQYPHALTMCLEAYDWSFARHVVKLPMSDLPENWVSDLELPYLYELPGDCVALRHVIETGANWRIDGTYLRASVEGGFSIRYTRLIENEKLLPSKFQYFVAAQLAGLLADVYVREGSEVDRINNKIVTSEQKAIDNDTLSASSSRSDDLPEAVDWVTEATR
ncbi:hypothetical protein [Pacificibacter marinus]|uniref:hypothetical protein n=1 Tax=Pacificibacter marinus TaxID=658057 RepID=UPI001C076FA3|nr:hypothetical protein [Pacificibacter marinus]MBU2867015.1 hypothetical protein [Pacificibacter marinus]